MATWASDNLPEGSVVIADSKALAFLDYVGQVEDRRERARLGSRRDLRCCGMGRSGRGRGGFGGFGRGRAMDASGNREREAMPSPMQRGRAEKLRKHYSGDRATRAILVAEDLMAWAKKKDIYWIGREREVDIALRSIPEDIDMEKVGEIKMPKPQAESSGGWSGLINRFLGGGRSRRNNTSNRTRRGGRGRGMNWGGLTGLLGGRRRGGGLTAMFHMRNDGTPLSVYRWKVK